MGWFEEGRAKGEEGRESDSALSSEPDMGLDFMFLGLWPELKPRVRC